MKNDPHDPIEDDPQYAQIMKLASEEALRELEGHPENGQRGFYSVVAATKKRILKEKYSVDWKRPSESDLNKLMGNMMD